MLEADEHSALPHINKHTHTQFHAPALPRAHSGSFGAGGTPPPPPLSSLPNIAAVAKAVLVVLSKSAVLKSLVLA